MLHKCQLILYLDFIMNTNGGSLSVPLFAVVCSLQWLIIFSKLFVEFFFHQQTGITSGQITLGQIQYIHIYIYIHSI